MVKIGFVGLGKWGINLLRALNSVEGADIKLCCDKERACLDAAKKVSPLADFTLDFKDVLTNKDIDAVVIATNAVTHGEFALRAIGSGKHVFVEKPLAMNLEQAVELVDLAKKEGKKLMVGHLLEYHPAVEKLKQMMTEGDLGKIYYIHSKRINFGMLRTDENALWSLGPHDISMICYLLDKEPLMVSAYGKSYVQKDIEDVVFINLQMSEDVSVYIHISWLDPLKIRKLTIVGSEKMAVFDDMESLEKLKIYDKAFMKKGNSFLTPLTSLAVRFGDIVAPKIEMIEPLKCECEHFISCIIEGRNPRSDGADGLRVIKVLTAAQQSLAENGKWVKI